MIRHLRIKRFYLEEIAAGRKIFEFRKLSPFYRWLENPDLKKIIFHYQSEVRLECDVVKVNIIKTPPRIQKAGVGDFADRCYRIKLSNPKLKRV